jgi:hypothetical protein
MAALAPAADPITAVREWIGWAETAERAQRDVLRGLRTHLARRPRTPRRETTAEWAARQEAKLAALGL